MIIYQGTLIGIKIEKFANGSLPITNTQEFLQVVTLKHPKGCYLKAHLHKPTVRKTQKLQECIIVKKGKIKLDLYTQDKKLIKYIFLRTGQAFILLNGGVGIKIIEDTEIYEVKNGPFKEDKILI